MDATTGEDAPRYGPPTGEWIVRDGVWSYAESGHSTGSGQGAKPQPRNRYAWALAVSPLFVVGTAVIVEAAGLDVSDSLLSAFGIGIALSLGMQDSKELEAVDVPMSHFLAGFLASFLGLIYLIVRAVRVRGGYLLPLVWCVALSIPIVGLVALAPPAPYDSRALERTLATELSETLGSEPDVSCPDGLADVGDHILCTVSVDDDPGAPVQIVKVQVTVRDDEGHYDVAVIH